MTSTKHARERDRRTSSKLTGFFEAKCGIAGAFALSLALAACSTDDGTGGGTGGMSQSSGGSSASGGSGGTAATGGTAPNTGGTGASSGGSGGTGGSGTGGVATGGTPGVGGSNTGGTGGVGPGGAGGAAGAPGDGGASGASGSAGTGGASTGSEGCEQPTDLATASWVETAVDVGGNMRPYSVWLPTGYDPARVYPVIFLLHGCGSGTNNPPLQNATGGDAILVRGTGSDGSCWNTDANGPDIPYIDAMVADVKARFCANTSAFFAVGYSSGSWLASQLGCMRSDVFRGLATVTGGLPPVSNCKDTPIAQMFVHDVDDNDNLIEWNEPARDRLLALNGCDMPPSSTPVDPSPCVSYQGCEPGYPVVWCATSGQGHARQDGLVVPAFWNFFQSLMED